MLVGEENGGWKLITTQLNHERVMLGPAGRVAGLYDRVHAWAASRAATASPRSTTRRAAARWARSRHLADQRTAQLAGGRGTARPSTSPTRPPRKSSARNGFSSVGRLAEEIVGKYGDPADPETADLLDWLDVQTKRNLVITFGGGVNEVMREMIATFGLKVPRVPR